MGIDWPPPPRKLGTSPTPWGRNRKGSLPWFLRGRWAEERGPEGELRIRINRRAPTYPLILVVRLFAQPISNWVLDASATCGPTRSFTMSTCRGSVA
jgi:hypothetical protein